MDIRDGRKRAKKGERKEKSPLNLINTPLMHFIQKHRFSAFVRPQMEREGGWKIFPGSGRSKSGEPPFQWWGLKITVEEDKRDSKSF